MSLGPGAAPAALTDRGIRSAATANLNDLQIGIRATKRIYDSTIAKGDVVRTDPAAGKTVDEGSDVTLYVSKGPAPVLIPDVAGESQADATARLKAAGLVVRVTHQFDDSTSSGQALGTSPRSGKPAHEGDTVTLIMSNGPHLYPVPNVVGKPLGTQSKRS